MKLGIEAIGTYIPEGRLSNLERRAQFGAEESFILDKIGFRQLAIKAPGEDVTEMCARAFKDLQSRTQVDEKSIEALVLVTQNPERILPSGSALIHGALGLSSSCAAFDIGLGCSGYVYGLSVLQAFMQANGMRRGLLFTCDPYSKIVDPADKATALIFGDAATVSLISSEPEVTSGRFSFGTVGQEAKALSCETGGSLFMNGRAVFNFTARWVPEDALNVLRLNGLGVDEIDRFIFHQGSKFILDALVDKLKLDPAKVPFASSEYGNTVSSSIPLILKDELLRESSRRILISGFGVGLSWASTVLTREGRN